MPGIDVIGSKLPILLGSLGFIVFVTLVVMYILRARKMYWQTADLSSRKQRKQKKERPKIAFLIASLVTCAATMLLAFILGIVAAIGFAIIAFLIIVLVFLGSGNGGGKSFIGNRPSGYG